MFKVGASANKRKAVDRDASATGRRERNRQDKRERIRDAAEDLFNECGYDAATTRDIARRAGVSLGTLFNYADDKRDLIFLIWVDRLDRITAEAFAGLSEGDLLQQLLRACLRACSAHSLLSMSPALCVPIVPLMARS